MPPKDTLTPDVRFGNSFLDEKYRDKSVLGEVLIDKIDAELFLKRPLDGKFISFMRRNTDMYDTGNELNIQLQNHPEFTFPGEDQIFLSLKYDIFGIQGVDHNILLENLEFLNQQDVNKKIEFKVTPESNGFFVKARTRENDRKTASFLNMEYNRYINENWLVAPPEYSSMDYFENGNCIMSYTGTTTGYDADGMEVQPVNFSGSVSIRLNENSIVLFPRNYAYGIETITSITIRITGFIFPKIQTMYSIYQEMGPPNDYPLPDNVIEIDNAVYLKELEVWTFVQNKEEIPTSENLFLNQVMDVFYLFEFIQKLKKVGDGNGFIPSPTRPQDVIWSTNNAWAEVIRTVSAGNIQTDQNSDTNIVDLEMFLYYLNYIRTGFTMDANDVDYLLIDDTEEVAGEIIEPTYN